MTTRSPHPATPLTRLSVALLVATTAITTPRVGTAKHPAANPVARLPQRRDAEGIVVLVVETKARDVAGPAIALVRLGRYIIRHAGKLHIDLNFGDCRRGCWIRASG